MSYDLYCFRSPSGRLDTKEADLIIGGDEPPTAEELTVMRELAARIVEFDNSLQVFEFDYELVAKTRSISIKEAHALLNYVEINTPEDDDDYLQLMVLKDHVALTFGFGMSEAFLARVMELVRVICSQTEYLFYDPQTGEGGDPTGQPSHHSAETEGYTSKPWWKLW